MIRQQQRIMAAIDTSHLEQEQLQGIGEFWLPTQFQEACWIATLLFHFCRLQQVAIGDWPDMSINQVISKTLCQDGLVTLLNLLLMPFIIQVNFGLNEKNMTSDFQDVFQELELKFTHRPARVQHENHCIGKWHKTLCNLSMRGIE